MQNFNGDSKETRKEGITIESQETTGNPEMIRNVQKKNMTYKTHEERKTTEASKSTLKSSFRAIHNPLVVVLSVY